MSILSAIIWAAMTATPFAAEFPTRPIRLIVPFPPGGTTDILARLIGPKLTEAFKQSVVIENRAGASGMIGADAIAKAPGDGHIFGIIISTHAISPALFAKSPFDPAKDFAPITLAISVANVISVHPSVPATSLAQLIALAKARPGALSFGSAGTGTAVHLTGELFKSVAHIDITHVPYKGGGPALSDLIAGQIPMGVQNITTIVPYVRSGRIRALGISVLERSPALPDVPTIASQGFPGFEAREWYGLVAPGGTPQAIVTRLNQEIVRAINLPDVRSRLLDLGADIVGDSPAQFGALIRSELVKWAKLLKETGIRLE
ncbi:MAG TPA: tripartite tricarboxylate transporter substrate binding protein [Burkholderiales bacterium]|nr:tripartite tricarboxylate transporter substrate binding protein [Burkholderiales bacterium]